jgi:hypothetical protein
MADLAAAVHVSFCGAPDEPAAKVDLFSALHQQIASKDEAVYLVSSDGKEFPIQEAVLKGSEFFKAALENETGKYHSSHSLRACMYARKFRRPVEPSIWFMECLKVRRLRRHSL